MAELKFRAYVFVSLISRTYLALSITYSNTNKLHCQKAAIEVQMCVFLDQFTVNDLKLRSELNLT